MNTDTRKMKSVIASPEHDSINNESLSFHETNASRGSKRAHELLEDHSNSDSKENEVLDSTALQNEKENDQDNAAQLLAIWRNLEKSADDGEGYDDAISNALEKTSQLVNEQIAEVIRCGLQSFHSLERLSRAHSVLQDECKAKTTEIQRLRLADEKQRKTIQVNARLSTSNP